MNIPVALRKVSLLFTVILSIGSTVVKGQTMRYFEFTLQCGHGNWQDSSIIAAASDETIIDTVLANIARPPDQRKFINGKIASGDGGHNHNASHRFKWHFIPDQWTLVENAIEVCDGCPYSDVDADTAYWLNTIKIFCPWSGQPSREVPEPVSVRNPDQKRNIRIAYNGQAKTIDVFKEASGRVNGNISIYDMAGIECKVSEESGSIDVADLPQGLYHVVLQEDLSGIVYSGRFIK